MYSEKSQKDRKQKSYGLVFIADISVHRIIISDKLIDEITYGIIAVRLIVVILLISLIIVVRVIALIIIILIITLIIVVLIIALISGGILDNILYNDRLVLLTVRLWILYFTLAIGTQTVFNADFRTTIFTLHKITPFQKDLF